MAEYIEREPLLEILNGLYNHHLTMGNYSADSATQDCIEAVIEAPTDDVVPRADYERVINACKNCREDDIVKAKWEGAREIFAELKTLIDEYLDGLYNTAEFIKIFHELENKYLEEKQL